MTAAAVVHAAVFVSGIVPAAWIEAVHARTVFPVLRVGLTTPASVLPFSLAECIAVALIVLTLAALAELALRLVRGRGKLRCGRVLVWTLVCIVHGYLLGFGWLYRRPPLRERLQLPAVTAPDALTAAARATASAANTAHCAPPDGYDFARAAADARAAVSRILPALGAGRLPITRVKPVFPAGLMMRFGVSGVFSPFTQEANVDPGIDRVEMPFTAAHELAHLAGFASEDEANFVAWLACTRSDVPFVRYSGHSAALARFLLRSDAAGRKQLREIAGPDVIADRIRIAETWRRRRSDLLSRIQTNVYDKMLKSQGVRSGVASYGEMIELVLAWRARASKR